MKLALTATPSQAEFAPILMRGNVADAFAMAAELGFAGVELHLRYPSDVDASEVRELMDRYGLGVPTLGTGMAAGMDGLSFPDPDPRTRSRAVERVEEHIRLAAVLGSYVTIGSLSGRLGPDSQERSARRRLATACLAECCEAAADAGVTIVLEPLNRYECDYLNTVDDVLEVLAEIDSPNLKVLADTFHMNIEEVDMAASLRRAGDKLAHLHLVDSNRQVPGHGHTDFAPILCSLRDIGYGGYVSFEVLPLPNPRRAAADGASFVESLLAEL